MGIYPAWFLSPFISLPSSSLADLLILLVLLLLATVVAGSVNRGRVGWSLFLLRGRIFGLGLCRVSWKGLEAEVILRFRIHPSLICRMK